MRSERKQNVPAKENGSNYDSVSKKLESDMILARLRMSYRKGPIYKHSRTGSRLEGPRVDSRMEARNDTRPDSMLQESRAILSTGTKQTLKDSRASVIDKNSSNLET